jgi:ABC-type amino acid transport substrate-binding protein
MKIERHCVRMALYLLTVIPFAAAISQESGGTLERVAKTGEFRIGYRTDASPLSYENAEGEPSGYSVDLCRRIATAVKTDLGLDRFDIKYVPIASDDRIDAVASGKVDIECGSTTITLSRLERVDFTLMTFITGGSILSLANSGIATLADLSGKTVGVVTGTTTVTQLNSHLEKNLIDAKVGELASREIAMKQLDGRKIDAFASDQIVLIGQVIESLTPRGYTLSEELFSYEPYALVVRRNDPAFRLVANRALVQLYSSGQHIQIYNKWIGRIGISPSPMLIAMYQMNTLPD